MNKIKFDLLPISLQDIFRLQQNECLLKGRMQTTLGIYCDSKMLHMADQIDHLMKNGNAIAAVKQQAAILQQQNLGKGCHISSSL